MDLPTPPKDIGLRNIIDKLAEFVARNGPEFEAITKAKQQGNPKFGFLYGGDYYQYYQWRVSSEQTSSLSQAQNLPPPPTGAAQSSIGGANASSASATNWDNGQKPNQGLQLGNHVAPHNNSVAAAAAASSEAAMLALGAQLEALNTQQTTLRDQIQQSEKNLSAQQGVLVAQQQSHVDEAIVSAQNEALVKQAIEHNIRLAEFDEVLQPIVDSCTKDSISAGKNWILQHTTDSPKCNVILQYLLKKALLNGAPFTQKLHLIYLVNDVLHHCVRKRAEDLKNQLENIVIPMFCSGQMQANDEQKAKLTKLLSLWESKANFFDACVISKLKSPASSMQEYKTNLMNTFASLVTQITQQTNGTFENYKQQHQTFIQHAGQQIVLLETQKQALLEKQKQAQAAAVAAAAVAAGLVASQLMGNNNNNNSNNSGMQQQQAPQQQQQPPSTSNPNNPFAQQNNLNNGVGNNSNNNMHSMRNDRGPPMIPSHQQQHSAMTNVHHPPPMGSQHPFASGGNGGDGNLGNNIDLNQFSNPEPPASMFQSNQKSHLVPPNQQQQHLNMHPQQQPMMLHHQQHLSVGGNPPGFEQMPPAFLIPDMSKPPPGFANPPPPDAMIAAQAAAQAAASLPSIMPAGPPQEVKPVAPFYELPAGLMVPLIRLEDYEYHPLEPEDLRLPPPVPPSDRLLSAVDAFYAPPSHDRARDCEGWEKLALYEYYKVKKSARKTKEEELAAGTRDRSREPSPIVIEPPRPLKVNKRRYRSKSRSRSRSPQPTVVVPEQSETEPQEPATPAQQQQQQQLLRKSPSPSPPPAAFSSAASSGGGGSDQSRKSVGGAKFGRYSNRSPKDRDSLSPPSGKRSTDRGGDRERISARAERESSVSPPPSFFGGNYAKPANECIEETNKGHQMLMKMGWAGSGTGLGSHGQGIDAPISGGEVRDRQDQFKGVGISLNDPYENFRKNKGAAFIHRMRARDTDKPVPSNGSPEP